MKIGSQKFKKLRKLKNKAIYMAPVACGVLQMQIANSGLTD